MKKLFVIMALLPVMAGAQSLEECQQAAERNYPLIRQYGLIAQTTELTVSNIRKGWLPQVSASAQATLQSDVVSWPEQMQSVYQQMGLDMRGLRKDQYRVGIDVQQMVFDGGAISSQKNIVREQGKVQEAQNEVTMYQVRRRVNEMYFGLLLLDKQIQLNHDLQEVLAANERKLSSMYERGTAAKSDYQTVKAERLNVVQQVSSLQAQRNAVARMLSMFCGLEVKELEKPQATSSGMQSAGQRPELKSIDAQLRLADAQEKALDAALMPKLSVFVQGYYGYPGYNMFEDMMSHRWSWNGLIGARLSWNIGALYTRKNDKAKIQLQRDMATTNRDVFLFNNQLEQIRQNEDIERYRRLMASDEEIIALRSSVRKAAESKLAHGIIDVNDLVREINNENAARLQMSVHEIEMLKEMYDLRFTTNN
ncbi:TolC family protein [Prevotella sp. Rep29]|uniref:TolC family protein n=1 Tax=Prevotella sp. Rep29 TaxID=2691580 RepID=UPI001C6F0E3C|nr:TolC family protein [Prevotella sp. Rep29]QYR10444.1 TolC family protein [Prevotella sp. Rep29]